MNIHVVKDEPARVPKWFAINWLGEKKDKEREDQTAREERMVRATNAAALAAWAAFITAAVSTVAATARLRFECLRSPA